MLCWLTRNPKEKEESHHQTRQNQNHQSKDPGIRLVSNPIRKKIHPFESTINSEIQSNDCQERIIAHGKEIPLAL